MIPVLIPMKDGQILYPYMYHSIANQSIGLAIIPITRTSSKNKNSNIKIQDIKDYKSDFIVILDYNIVLLEDNVIENSIKKLQGSKDLAVVHLNTKNTLVKLLETSNCDVNCIVAKKSVLQKMPLHNETSSLYSCEGFHKAIKEMGYTSSYLAPHQQARIFNFYS